MHKDGKWAKQIISLQHSDGKWGCFHSLSQFYDAPITTEQALRRLERLGFTIEDECIQKAVAYMHDCLVGKNSIPDRAEKCHDWVIFTSLILATWIRRFTPDDPAANDVAKKWSDIASSAFADGTFDNNAYITAYNDLLKPNGGRIINLLNFYPVSLLSDCTDKKTQEAFLDYVLNNNGGIYYIYDRKIADLPMVFQSREASRYIAAIELLAMYKHTRCKLEFVVDWLNDNRNEKGKWDMGRIVNDKVYFPLSDDWRKSETREADCTERITRVMNALHT